MSYGVSQGTILSPILFLIYVNDVHSSLLHGKIVQYADDTTLCFRDNSQEGLEQQTFAGLNNCVQYFNSLNLQTNSSKSNVLNFALRSVDSQCGPAVMLADSILEEVYSSKFLGIFLDRGLTWNNHIDHVCAKLSSGIYVLRSLA
uniref:Reverse transcriptase domain-containing protein n=1 Tax=Graphocephala atropunctata TaxID=36148 RepID=A0A1B6KHY9_9HEMI